MAFSTGGGGGVGVGYPGGDHNLCLREINATPPSPHLYFFFLPSFAEEWELSACTKREQSTRIPFTGSTRSTWNPRGHRTRPRPVITGWVGANNRMMAMCVCVCVYIYTYIHTRTSTSELSLITCWTEWWRWYTHSHQTPCAYCIHAEWALRTLGVMTSVHTPSQERGPIILIITIIRYISCPKRDYSMRMHTRTDTDRHGQTRTCNTYINIHYK